jgi:hypothetical protein
LSLPFNSLRQHALDRAIEKLYPESAKAGPATPWLQFEHMKSGFLAVLGKQLNLGDDMMIDLARLDKDPL